MVEVTLMAIVIKKFDVISEEDSVSQIEEFQDAPIGQYLVGEVNALRDVDK